MGWAAGSQLGEELYLTVREYIPWRDRKEVAQKFYDAVCDLDADDWDGTSQLEIDAEINYDEEQKMPKVVLEFETKEDRDKWLGAYYNSGEQELAEYWQQDGEEMPDIKITEE